MGNSITHRGRPRGEKRQALAGWMSVNPSFTMGDVSRSLGWSVQTADKTLSRALASGEVKVCGSKRTPTAKRPVAVYARADYNPGAVPLAGLLRVWA